MPEEPLCALPDAAVHEQASHPFTDSTQCGGASEEAAWYKPYRCVPVQLRLSKRGTPISNRLRTPVGTPLPNGLWKVFLGRHQTINNLGSSSYARAWILSDVTERKGGGQGRNRTQFARRNPKNLAAPCELTFSNDRGTRNLDPGGGFPLGSRNEKGPSKKGPFLFLVARGGIEPPTRGFSIRCSTN